MSVSGSNTLHQDERLVVEELECTDATVSDDLMVGDRATVGGDLVVTGNLGVGDQSVPHSATIALAKSTTTDGMDISVTLKNAASVAVTGVYTFVLYMSESNSGAGITGDTYSGDLTATTGAILTALSAKKAWLVATSAGGVFAGTLVASANPADQYVVAIHPLNGKPIVSAASGTNWEGAS
jgi:hypothetical protein